MLGGMKISVINQTARVGAVELEVMCRALTVQAAQFCGEWDRIPAQVVPAEKMPEQGAVILLQERLDNPDLLGVHAEEAGRYVGRVSIDAVLEAGGGVLSSSSGGPSVSSVLSHEVLEILGDANGETWVSGPEVEQGAEYALEVCDPVQASYYEVEGAPGVPVQVSNFLVPAWFEESTTSDFMDWLLLLTKPFTLAPGGYMIVRRIGDGGSVTASLRTAPAAPEKRAGCRASRRMGC